MCAHSVESRERARKGRSRLSLFAQGVGELLMTLGTLVLLFAGYVTWGTDFRNATHQNDLSSALHNAWKTPAAPDGPPAVISPDTPNGSPVAVIWVPSFGKDYHQTIVEGVDLSDLELGPGHYPGTASPGEVGNFSVAGHRTGNGAPFDDLPNLKAGAFIVIEMKDYYYTYRVLGDLATGDATVPDAQGIPGKVIVDPSHVDVVAPVPENPTAQPTRRLITLTTCDPWWSGENRLIIHGELDGAPWPKSQGLPPALKG
ncbi:class E sortase [Smaragdicoccus niigatensis]|uniref:class E sortase n=1 Tax=Smaragdicoccus niigatensis TaxID=359359 RepID=UPI0020D0CCFF|nr:class E sortase [Smaragdicoccus niigatensis]